MGASPFPILVDLFLYSSQVIAKRGTEEADGAANTVGKIQDKSSRPSFCKPVYNSTTKASGRKRKLYTGQQAVSAVPDIKIDEATTTVTQEQAKTSGEAGARQRRVRL